MNTDEALLTLGRGAGEAMAEVLASLGSTEVEGLEVTVIAADAPPLGGVAFPAVATDVAFSGGVTGGNVFVITRLGARRLAAKMMFAEPPEEDSGADLDELELSALGEAMNQMMAASAAALATTLGYAVEISVPTTRTLAAIEDAEGIYPDTPHATRVSFSILGEPCRLIQLVPNAFVVRMTRALDGVASDEVAADSPQLQTGLLTSALRDAPVRVAAEFGRARMRLDQLAHPREGAVVELDRTADDPLDLCINGQRFATGALVLIADGEWAFRIERLLDVNPADYVSQTGGA